MCAVGRDFIYFFYHAIYPRNYRIVAVFTVMLVGTSWLRVYNQNVLSVAERIEIFRDSVKW